MDKTQHTGYCLLTAFALLPAISHAQSTTPESDTTDSKRLETIVVEPAGEPEAPLPLGTAVSGKTLATTPGSAGDPLRSLQSFPGLAFTDDTEAEPAVRGSRPDDNYFEVDFVPAEYLFHAGGLISVFNADLVDSFSIYPSAYGPEYAGVTGGVFDVKLRDPKTDRFHTTLDIGILQSGLLVEGPINDSQSFYLAGRASYLDLVIGTQTDEDAEEGVTLVQFPKYTDYQAKYLWQVNDDAKLTFSANGATDDATIDIDETAEEVQTDPILVGRFQEESAFNQQSVVLDVRFSDDMSFKSAIAHSRGEEQFRIGGAGSISILSDKWFSRAQLDMTLADNHDLSIGGRVAYNDYEVDLDFNVPLCTEFEPDCTLTEAERIAVNIDDNATFLNFFVKDNWYVTDKLTLFPGISLQSDNALDKSFVEPRVALEYAVSDSLVLSAGAGIYHQLPYFDQFDDELGNPDLDYIESVQAVAGVYKEFGDGWNIKSEVYYKQLDQLVTGDEANRYANNGEGETIGFDTLIRKDLTDRFSGWLSLSVSGSTRTNKRTGEKFDFEFDQPFNASLVTSYKLSDKWRIGAKFWMHSGALFTPVTGSTPDEEIDGFFIPQYGALNSERFPDYRRLDLRLDRTVKRSKGRTFSTYIELLNALGSKNVSYYEYNADYSEREESEQLPPIVALGFKAEF